MAKSRVQLMRRAERVMEAAIGFPPAQAVRPAEMQALTEKWLADVMSAALDIYELRAEEDDEPVVVWRGNAAPTQSQIDRAALSATSRGWNGTSFELYCAGRWVQTAKPSDEALA